MFHCQKVPLWFPEKCKVDVLTHWESNLLSFSTELYEIFLSRAKERWRSFSETGSETEADGWSEAGVGWVGRSPQGTRLWISASNAHTHPFSSLPVWDKAISSRCFYIWGPWHIVELKLSSAAATLASHYCTNPLTQQPFAGLVQRLSVVFPPVICKAPVSTIMSDCLPIGPVLRVNSDTFKALTSVAH